MLIVILEFAPIRCFLVICTILPYNIPVPIHQTRKQTHRTLQSQVNMSNGAGITVLRILDSRREQFRLSKAYVDKIEVINVITAPEIEMLIIFRKGKYEEYKRSGMKPSEFSKIELRYSNVKNAEFVKSYFADTAILISALKEYKRVSHIQRGEYTLADLLK